MLLKKSELFFLEFKVRLLFVFNSFPSLDSFESLLRSNRLTKWQALRKDRFEVNASFYSFS